MAAYIHYLKGCHCVMMFHAGKADISVSIVLTILLKGAGRRTEIVFRLPLV